MRSKISPAVREEPSFIETARREQIVRCAAETIAELGYARASLAEIAKRARISKSVISYYFETKDALTRAVVEDVYATGHAFMLPRIQAAASVRDMLRAYIRANVDFIGVHRTKLLALISIIATYRNDDGQISLEPSAISPAVGELEPLLKLGQESGEFRAFATEPMAVTMRASLDALPWRLSVLPELDLDAYADELVELFDRATVAPGKGSS
jgi:TetR/AcrR family fatty acid metabolism transcriptional regulator